MRSEAKNEILDRYFGYYGYSGYVRYQERTIARHLSQQVPFRQPYLLKMLRRCTANELTEGRTPSLEP